MRKYFLLFFLLMVVTINPLQLSLFDISKAYAEKNLVSEDLDANKEQLSQIMQNILENQEKILIDIKAEEKQFLKDIPHALRELSTLSQSVYNDFSKLYKVYWLSQNHPTELSFVSEQLNKFIYQITQLY